MAMPLPRLIFLLGVLLAHGLLFVPLYQRVGLAASALAVLIAALSGVLLGRRGGLLISCGVLLINQALLYYVIGEQPLLNLPRALLGSLVVLIVGYAAGWLTDLLQQVRRQVQALDLEIQRRTQLEAELVQARAVAEAANQAKSQFLATMSHELRTPLNAILGYSELIQEEAEELTPPELVAEVEKIHDAGAHLLTLINGILDLAKIEAGKMELTPETFAVAPLAEQVATTVRRVVEKHSNTLRLDLAPDLGTIHTDQLKLKQVLLNLLSNAAKFTSNGTITLTITRTTTPPPALAPSPDPSTNLPPDWLAFRITDTGIGMSPAQVQQLFAAFTQVHANTGRNYGGTGLGLALSRRFCQMMGGDITVESQLGIGSTFTVYLPATIPAWLPNTQNVAAPG
jgi:signal transduction histidine kinase